MFNNRLGLELMMDFPTPATAAAADDADDVDDDDDSDVLHIFSVV